LPKFNENIKINKFSQKFFGYVNELLKKHGLPKNMNKQELESKSKKNLKIISSFTEGSIKEK